jgi:hypothetical protein
MPEVTSPTSESTVYHLKQMQGELYRLAGAREAALNASAGAHALAYVISPADTAAQKAALADKHRMDGMQMAKDRYVGEVRHFDGDEAALLARCVKMFADLAAYERQEAERTSLNVVHLDPEHADYRKVSLEVQRYLQREAGILEYADMFRAAFGSLLDRPAPPAAVADPA